VKVAAPPKPEMAFSDRAIVGEQLPEVAEAFRDKTVLVTGAGGSIGSEIARQVAQSPARKLVLFDQDENSIFERNNELLGMKTGTTIVPLVGDIRDKVRIHDVFSRHEPHIVLHAAAYKHVPVMEQNCSEAILNNVIGTRILADACAEFAAERFLMISTDKAVNPISVMGASKRVAEVLVQNRARMHSGKTPTRFACVRFGNVVGSRGSVLPIFLKQIAEGLPLTITHEAMTRYFMTIPEAVQLVLQACSLGSNGDIFMLDMGDPVKIKDLARRLIEMSGLRPGEDVEIRVIGVRPGEKLHEELWNKDAKVSATSFARVFRVHAEGVEDDFERELAGLEQIALRREDKEVYDRLFHLLALLPEKKNKERAAAAVRML